MKEAGQSAHVLWDYMLMKLLTDASTETKHRVVISWSCLDRNTILIHLGGEVLINGDDKIFICINQESYIAALKHASY